jgi:hypothetical protein
MDEDASVGGLASPAIVPYYGTPICVDIRAALTQGQYIIAPPSASIGD